MMKCLSYSDLRSLASPPQAGTSYNTTVRGSVHPHLRPTAFGSSRTAGTLDATPHTYGEIRMGKFLITMLCHAERGSDPSERAAEWSVWVPRFLDLLDSIEKETGKRVSLTWCCCANYAREYAEAGTILVAQECPEVWRRIQDRGDEVGLHIHFDPEIPGPSQLHPGTVGLMHEFQHLFLEESVSRMVDFGFPQPKTYTPGNQVWRKEWAQHLLEHGFEVDSTIMALPSKYLGWTNLLEQVFSADITNYLLWHHRPESYPFRPYRTHPDDLAQEGNSELVELPVIGWITCDIYPEDAYFNNSPPFDTIVPLEELTPQTWISFRFGQFEQDYQKPFPGLFERWRRRNETAVDIWPTFFHPRELHDSNLKRLGSFIRTLLEWDDVAFVMASSAVTDWKQCNPTPVCI